MAAALPALVVTLPLVGHSVLGDDRRRLYWAARQVGSNPIEALDRSLRGVGGFLDRGNSRPVGRTVESFERAVVFDVGEAAGLPAHAVNGVSRVALIAALAVVSFGVLSAVLRSAGFDAAGSGRATVVLYPLVLAVFLVAGDHYSPLTSYTMMLTGSVIVILATGLWVARDRDMEARRLSWHEPVVIVAFGAALAATYDRTYLAPPFSGAFVAARALARPRPSTLRQFVRLASVPADRATPFHAITAEMATAAVHFDPTLGGNERRCALVRHYTAILPNPQQWVSGPNVGAELDELMLSLRGTPFCEPEDARVVTSNAR